MAQGKEHIPTPESRHLVEELSGFGLSHENIGSLIDGGIDRDTLAKHYRQELDEGKAKANAAVAKSLFQRAIHDDNPTSAIWWSKTQMGWKETKIQEHTIGGLAELLSSIPK